MASSELILNADGSIYHLGLLPEHLAPLIITVGDPERVAEVSARFDAIDFRQNRREFVTHVGRFAGRRIMCISTGIGTDNVDIVLNELDALANVDLQSGNVKSVVRQLTVLRLGTSGTFQPDIPVDSILVSAAATGVDGLGPFYRFLRGSAARQLATEFPDFASGVYNANAEERLKAEWLLRHREHLSGTTLTCAGFYGPQRRSIRLPFEGPTLEELASLRFQDEVVGGGERFTNFEMETAGIYGLAGLLGHRALSVSAILANRATGAFSKQPAATVDKLIDAAFQCLSADPELWWGERSD